MYILSLPSNQSLQQQICETLPALPLHGEPLPSSTMQEIMSNPYLNAVIKETLLIYPAISGTLPRLTPPGGRLIDGVWLPGKTIAGGNVYSVNTSLVDDLNWQPERWLVNEHLSSEDQKAEKKRIEQLERHLWTFASGGRGKYCINLVFSLVNKGFYLSMFSNDD